MFIFIRQITKGLQVYSIYESARKKAKIEFSMDKEKTKKKR